MQQSPLVAALETNDSFEVDIGTLVLHVHKLVVLSSPILRFFNILDKLRRWEAASVCVVILLFFNLSCLCLPSVYCMTMVLGGALAAGSLGVMHRHTRLLSKVFPPCSAKLDDLVGVSGDQLSHEEMVQLYKAMLHRIDIIVQRLNGYLTSFYSVLKWEDVQISVRWYVCVLMTILCLHLVPMRWSIVMVINLVLMEGKISEIIVSSALCRKMWTTVHPVPPLHPIASESSIGRVSQRSEESLCTDTPVTGVSDTESEPEADERLEDQDNSSGPESDSDTNMASATSGEVKVTGRSGMVRKLLEFKNKHQQGSCIGCGATFSTILRRRHVCTHCGNHYCSWCCSKRVPRSLFGATAPAAQKETVLVCVFCHMYLTGQKDVT